MNKLKRVILLLETSRGFGRDLITGIARYSKLNGPWSFFREPRGLKSAVPHTENWDADGIIMRNTAISKKLLALKVPVITVLHYQKKDSKIPVVKTDSKAISILAGRHLLNRGFKNFAFCGFRDLDWSNERQENFSRFLEGNMVYLYNQPKNKSWEKEQFIMANWLKNLPKPIGVMACNDDRGQHVLEACKIAEIHVPEELAVIGVDNDTLICDLSDPPLTSIALNTLDAGFKTAELLDQMMNGLEMDGQEIMVSPTHVVKRHSTDILAINDHNLITSLAYIKENYRDKITVSDILKVTSVNRRSLEGKFKIILGRSIMDEVKRLRIDQMCKLLIESDMSISEITALFTFTKIEHISRYFRQEKQISMREFRKRLKRC